MHPAHRRSHGSIYSFCHHPCPRCVSTSQARNLDARTPPPPPFPVPPHQAQPAHVSMLRKNIVCLTRTPPASVFLMPSRLIQPAHPPYPSSGLHNSEEYGFRTVRIIDDQAAPAFSALDETKCLFSLAGRAPAQ